MTTFQNLIDETRDHLMTEKPDRVNVLDSGVGVNATSLVMRNEVVGIGAGSKVSIGLEIYLVTADPTSTTPGTSLTVIPAFAGSTSSAHNAGDLVYVNPQFSNYRIAQQLNHCITSLDSHGLFQVKNKLIPYESAVAGYNLDAAGFIDVWRVSYDYPGPTNDWPVLLPQDYYVDVSADTTDFASGRQFVLRQGGYPGFNIKISYKAEYTALVNPTDDVETVAGIHRSAHEIPSLGAAMRILTGGEVKRTFLTSQPEPRRQDEVPPGSIRQSMIPIVTAYYQAIDREILYLHRKYPTQTG